jgi:hypothetical protein
MTGKVSTDDGSKQSLLIIPIAMAVIIIARTWLFIVLFFASLIAWKIYDKIQWMNQCDKYNSSFNYLIKENKGCLTSLDFSQKTSLGERTAKDFLERKAQEYGAIKKIVAGKEIVYYFITASALGSIFDESDEKDLTPSIVSSSQPNVLTELAQLKKTNLDPMVLVNKISESDLSDSIEPMAHEIGTSKDEANVLELSQVELAKRLDINPTTIAKRKSDPNFTEWSQSKDPEGIGWIYVESTKFFVSLIS